jgi:hypothetical protein
MLDVYTNANLAEKLQKLNFLAKWLAETNN